MRAELNTNFTRGSTLSTVHTVEREKSNRQKERNLRTWRRKLSGILLTVALVCGLGVLALTQYSGSFSDIISNVSTLKTADADKYKKVINEYLSKNPFERFGFARRDDNMTNYVTRQAPEIRAVTIKQSGMLLGKLGLEFREPVAMWTTASKTSYVDAEGIVFSQNFFASPKVTIIDNSGATVNSDIVASTRFLGFIGQVIAEIENNSINKVERVVIPTGAIRYVELYLTGRKYPFKAQIDRDATAQAAGIIAIVNHIDSKHLRPSYVDVRVTGKAYWK
jgi:tetrahydromethanopterin S-methyltransferase subunit A